MDILGDLGGIAEIILKVIGFVLLPISEFSFNLQAIGDTYFARTKDQRLFRQYQESENVQTIDIPFMNKFQLYFSLLLNDLCCGCIYGKKKRDQSKMNLLVTLYQEGTNRIDHQLSVDNILRKMNEAQITLDQLNDKVGLTQES